MRPDLGFAIFLVVSLVGPFVYGIIDAIRRRRR